MKEENNRLVLFEGKKVRRIWHNDEWYFSVVDIIEILSESPTPRQYWGKIKYREFTQLQLSPIWVQLKLPAEDGKYYSTDCVNTQNALRLVQSISSPNAEPFKLWLAKVGYERIQEIQNPEERGEILACLLKNWNFSSQSKKEISGILKRLQIN